MTNTRISFIAAVLALLVGFLAVALVISFEDTAPTAAVEPVVMEPEPEPLPRSLVTEQLLSEDTSMPTWECLRGLGLTGVVESPVNVEALYPTVEQLEFCSGPASIVAGPATESDAQLRCLAALGFEARSDGTMLVDGVGFEWCYAGARV